MVLLQLPPLRRREGDVRLLAEHFLSLESAEQGRARRDLGPEALQVLEACAWPGNVRQLRNEMRRVTLLGEGPVSPDDFSAEVLQVEAPEPLVDDASLPLPERVEAIESAAILGALARSQGNRSKAANNLGITRFALLRKIEKYRLAPGPDEDETP